MQISTYVNTRGKVVISGSEDDRTTFMVEMDPDVATGFGQAVKDNADKSRGIRQLYDDIQEVYSDLDV